MEVQQSGMNIDYREQLRMEIIKLIMRGEAQNAGAYMEEYEPIAEEGVELYSMKGIILIKQNRLDEAEKSLKRGLDFKHTAFDLLHNMGTVYLLKGKKELAVDYYRQALIVADTEELKAEAVKSLDKINKEKIRHKPLVSIILLAYNKLEYTKQCVDSLYRYSSHIDFELITVNNGSSDGTKEYFDSLPNAKKINFLQNAGADRPVNEALKFADGEFTLFLSNDLILTHGWLDNLLACIQSDEKIGMVVPVCNFASNCQMIGLNYSTLDEMHKAAREYNRSDPRKWEERIRLVVYTFLMCTKLLERLGGIDEEYSPGGFEDDDLSFRVRREGYKLIVAGDTFIYHYGSVSMGDEYASKSNLLERNRSIFFRKFGVDAWGDTWFDFEILDLLEFNKQQDVNILEIGFSCGSTSLQIKNRLKANGVTDVTLWYLTEDEKFLTDLKTVCDCAVCNLFERVSSIFKGMKFDYIIIGSDYKLEALLDNVEELLKEKGQLVFSAARENGDRFKSKISNGQRWRKYTLTEIQRVNRLIFTMEEKKRPGNVLLYPGYDFWLNNKCLEDNNIGNFLGVDAGKNSIGMLRDELGTRGWNICTIDKGSTDDAGYAIFFDLPKNESNPFFSHVFQLVRKGQKYFAECLRKKPELKLVLFLLEPPFVMPENYDRSLHEGFDIVFTYNDDMVDNIKYFKYFYSQPSRLNNEYVKAFGEKKLCTLIAGNKFSGVHGELYGERRKAIEYFENNHRDEFDLYGSGWQNAGYGSYKGAIGGKLQALSGYKYCICYENGILNGYITEKIFDCFFAGCVPIYLGAPNITDYIPDSTFIDFRRFDSYDGLYSFISGMDEEKYNEYLNSINAFLKSDGFKKFTHESFAKTVADVIEGFKKYEDSE